MSKFKVGDRVKTRFGSGEIVFINEYDEDVYLVKHDNWEKGHNGGGYEGVKKLYLKGNNCYWFREELLELVKRKRQRIVITTNLQEVIAYGYFNGEKKKASAKCNPSDTFDFEVGAKLAIERLFDKGVKEEPKLYNAKVVCIKELSEVTTIGKIYEVKDGIIKLDNGRFSDYCYTSLDNLNEKCISKFIEVVE